MKGLQSREKHIQLSKLPQKNDARFATFGLSARNARLREFHFINKNNVVANFDNDKRKHGEKGYWDIITHLPVDMLDFIQENKIDYVLIMSDAVEKIGEQLDLYNIEYYSSLLLKKLQNTSDSVHTPINNYDPTLMEVMKNLSEPILRCFDLEKSLIITHDALHHCCAHMPSGYDAMICEFSGGPFPIDVYNRSFREKVLQIMTNTGSCKGCPALRHAPPTVWHKELRNITIGAHLDCQLACTYCTQEKHKYLGGDYNSFSVMPLMRDLLMYELVGENTVATFVGGEPTLYPHFEETLDFCIENNFFSSVVTNAVIFSPAIVNALSIDKAKVVVSQDSGTAETFRMIKRVDAHDRTWENIKQYCRYGDVQIKYILLEENMNIKEMSAFIEKCLWAGGKKVVIAAELGIYGRLKKGTDSHNEYIKWAEKLRDMAHSHNLKTNFLIFDNDDIAYLNSLNEG